MFAQSMDVLSKNGEHSYENPTWEQVRAALIGLDGATCDSIILNGPTENSYMGCSGGIYGQYVVGGKDKDGKDFIMHSGPIRNGPFVLISSGGQDSEYAEHEVVTLQMVLAVARTYLETGECDPLYSWGQFAYRQRR